MIVNIEMNSQVPIFEQLKEQIITGILKGDLSNNEKLPSVRQLSSDLGINMHTVNKVYKILENEGFLTINKKQGAFINLNDEKIRINYKKHALEKEIGLKLMLYKQVDGNMENIKKMINEFEVE